MLNLRKKLIYDVSQTDGVVLLANLIADGGPLFCVYTGWFGGKQKFCNLHRKHVKEIYFGKQINSPFCQKSDILKRYTF